MVGIITEACFIWWLIGKQGNQAGIRAQPSKACPCDLLPPVRPDGNISDLTSIGKVALNAQLVLIKIRALFKSHRAQKPDSSNTHHIDACKRLSTERRGKKASGQSAGGPKA